MTLAGSTPWGGHLDGVYRFLPRPIPHFAREHSAHGADSGPLVLYRAPNGTGFGAASAALSADDGVWLIDSDLDTSAYYAYAVDHDAAWPTEIGVGAATGGTAGRAEWIVYGGGGWLRNRLRIRCEGAPVPTTA